MEINGNNGNRLVSIYIPDHFDDTSTPTEI